MSIINNYRAALLIAATALAPVATPTPGHIYIRRQGSATTKIRL